MRGAALLKAAGVQATQVYPKQGGTPTERATRNPDRVRNLAPAPRSAPRRKQSTMELPAAGDPLLRQTLPTKLQALKDIFAAIQTVYEMLRRRGKRTTFSNLKSAVEEASSRRFAESHLHQLHTLLPECFSLETVNLPVSPRSTRTACQTLLSMLPEAAEQPPAALRALLHSRLAQHLLDAYAAHLRAAARERHQAGEPVEASALEKRAGQRQAPILEFLAPFPEGVPDVGAAQGPLSSDSGTRTNVSSPRPVSSCARVTFSGSLGTTASEDQPILARAGVAAAIIPAAATNAAGPSSVPISTAAATAVAAVQKSVGQKPTSRAVVALTAAEARTRRLSFTASAGSTEAILGAARKDDAALLLGVPEALRRRSLEGIISMESLRVLEGNEAIHRRLSTQDARDARDAAAALGALPRTFARVKRIFGARGPSAMKMNDVILKIKQGGAEMSSEAEILAQIKTLAEHAPEFVQLKPWGVCKTPAVWIDRRCDGNIVAAKLKEIAERRLSRQSVGGVAVGGRGGEKAQQVQQRVAVAP
jgi:DNA replication factor CDT1 like/DNA replication factor Cdt1 C-terminal domain